MSSFKQATRATRAASDAMTAVGRNSLHGGEMLMAAGEVIGKRVALGTAAMLNPGAADHAEFALMVPEKAEAFAAAGAALTDSSLKAARYATRMVANEASLAAGMCTATCMALATGRDPAHLLGLQTEYAAGLWGRTLATTMRLGVMALEAQAATLAPVHATATANARRLRG